jgi:hypothetical protein
VSVKNQWYCGVEGQQYGPYTWEQMRAMADEGRLVAESYVRREVDQQWLTASQVPGLLKKKSKPAAAASSTQVALPDRRAKASGGSSVAAPPAAAPPVVAPAASNGSGSAIAAKVRTVQAATPSTGNIPVGSAVVGPVAPAAPIVSVSVQAAPAPARAKWKTEEEVEPEPKKNNTLLLVGVLGGVVVFIALAGVGLVVWKRGHDRAREQAEAKAAAEQAAADLAAALPAATGESNPLTAAEINPETPAVSAAPPAVTAVDTAPPAPANVSKTSAAPSDPAAAKLISKLSGWIDVTRSGGIKLLEVRLSVDSAWLAADETGTRIEPTDAKPGDAKYVFVTLKLTNTAKGPRPYTSWNATAGTTVVLADSSGQTLDLVPPSATPGASRQGKVDLAPGQVLTDTLVFEAPPASVEKLRLALAKNAIAGNAKTRGTHFAFEIPQEVLLRGSPGPRGPIDPNMRPPEGPITANQAPSSIPQDPVAGALGATVAPATPMPAAPMPGAAPAPAPPAAPKFDPKAFDLELQKDAGLLDKDGKPVKGDAK